MLLLNNESLFYLWKLKLLWKNECELIQGKVAQNISKANLEHQFFLSLLHKYTHTYTHINIKKKAESLMMGKPFLYVSLMKQRVDLLRYCVAFSLQINSVFHPQKSTTHEKMYGKHKH